METQKMEYVTHLTIFIDEKNKCEASPGTRERKYYHW